MIKEKTIGGLESYIIEPEGEATSIVFLLHGYGADGRDLISISAEWRTALPHTIFISPNAPFPCEMSPMGRQWFSLNPYTIEAMTDNIKPAHETLSNYIDAVLDHFDLQDDQMILSGFSQGCMMSLYTGLRRDKNCAGILGYSGRLLGEDAIPDGKSGIPVHLIHGLADDVVPAESWTHAKDTLEAKKFTVTGHRTPNLGHGIDMEGLRSGSGFIQKCLG